MPQWKLFFTDKAEQDFAKLSKETCRRISEKLDWLSLNFEQINPLALTNEWQGFFKLRIGEQRVIYKIDWSKNIIGVWLVDKRDKVYKNK